MHRKITLGNFKRIRNEKINEIFIIFLLLLRITKIFC